jgi:hypothetical protein
MRLSVCGRPMEHWSMVGSKVEGTLAYGSVVRSFQYWLFHQSGFWALVSANQIFLDPGIGESDCFEPALQPIRFLGLAVSASQVFLAHGFNQSGF